MDRFDQTSMRTRRAAVAEVLFDAWTRAASNELRRHEGATLNQFWVLLIASDHGSISISAMVELLELNYTTIAECVGSLERLGAVAKTVDENDRRAFSVCLTDKGHKLFDALDLCLARTAKKALAPLTGHAKIEAMGMFHQLCERVDKPRRAGNLIRGDSAFLIACKQCVMVFSNLCKKHVLTPLQGRIVLVLGCQGTLGIKRLRQMLFQDAPTLSRALKKLESLGYIRKTPGNTKRETNVALTTSGKLCAGALAQETVETLESLLGSDFDGALFAHTLECLYASLVDNHDLLGD